MRNAGYGSAALAALGALTLWACNSDGPVAVDSRPWREVAAAASPAPKMLSAARCASGAGGFTIVFTNPWFPAPVGRQWVYSGEEDGDEVALQITVLDMTRDIDGVTTRVIEEREWINSVLKEVSWNYYVQASDGTVCYDGEDVDIYENGTITHEGAWCAAAAGQAAGIFVPGDPLPGMKYPMEIAPGVAEDQGMIVGSGPVTVPLGRYVETIRIRESNPIDGDKGYKVFARNTGLIVDGPLQLEAINQTNGAPDQPVLTAQVCGS